MPGAQTFSNLNSEEMPNAATITWQLKVGFKNMEAIGNIELKAEARS
jgi:hypothetical protein